MYSLLSKSTPDVREVNEAYRQISLEKGSPKWSSAGRQLDRWVGSQENKTGKAGRFSINKTVFLVQAQTVFAGIDYFRDKRKHKQRASQVKLSWSVTICPNLHLPITDLFSVTLLCTPAQLLPVTHHRRIYFLDAQYSDALELDPHLKTDFRPATGHLDWQRASYYWRLHQNSSAPGQ